MSSVGREHEKKWKEDGTSYECRTEANALKRRCVKFSLCKYIRNVNLKCIFFAIDYIFGLPTFYVCLHIFGIHSNYIRLHLDYMFLHVNHYICFRVDRYYFYQLRKNPFSVPKSSCVLMSYITWCMNN